MSQRRMSPRFLGVKKVDKRRVYLLDKSNDNVNSHFVLYLKCIKHFASNINISAEQTNEPKVCEFVKFLEIRSC